MRFRKLRTLQLCRADPWQFARSPNPHTIRSCCLLFQCSENCERFIVATIFGYLLQVGIGHCNPLHGHGNNGCRAFLTFIIEGFSPLYTWS